MVSLWVPVLASHRTIIRIRHINLQKSELRYVSFGSLDRDDSPVEIHVMLISLFHVLNWYSKFSVLHKEQSILVLLVRYKLQQRIDRVHRSLHQELLLWMYSVTLTVQCLTVRHRLLCPRLIHLVGRKQPQCITELSLISSHYVMWCWVSAVSLAGFLKIKI